MSLDWTTGPLAAGLACYRSHEFFAAHEHWEDVWNHLADPERSFLQGLIQVTVAMHHYQRGNRAGAQSLLQRALQRFDRCPGSFTGIVISSLAAEVRAWLHSLQAGAPSVPPPPIIRLVEPWHPPENVRR